MKKAPVSLKDIAKELNISISTVSRALRNHPDISPELTQKIKDLARERHYQPNPYAMRLLRHISKTIGVIVPDMVTYFYSSIISGIESYCREKGYVVLITSSQESAVKESENIDNLLSMRVDGLIICLSQETDQFQPFDKLMQEHIPLVFFDRVCRTQDVSSVVADNFEAARNITRHLFEGGSRRIAFINGPGYLSISRERMGGYIEGLKDCGLKINKNLLVSCRLDALSAREAIQRLLGLSEIPDAIFTINDYVAFLTMKEIKNRGYKIPDDIALVGFTDEYHATLVEPELTSVMHPTFEMGQEAARLLIQQIETNIPATPRQVVMKTNLVIRESSIKFKIKKNGKNRDAKN